MDSLSGMLAAIRAAQSPAGHDLEEALQLARAAQAPKPNPPPPSDLVLDLDPLPTLLDTPRAAPGAAASAMDWLVASLPAELVQQALDILRSPSADGDIAESLLELYGFERIDQVGEAVQRRAAIVAAASAPAPAAQAESYAPTTHHQHHPPPHLMAPPPRDFTPQAQVMFHTAEEIAMAKKAHKAQQRFHRGQKGRGGYDEDGDLDLEEWERIRAEQLAQGPGPLVSGRRVSSSKRCALRRLTLFCFISPLMMSLSAIPTSTSRVEPPALRSLSADRGWRCRLERLEKTME